MSALDELVKKDLQKYSALEHTIFRVWCEGKSSKDEMSDTILLMADLAATELAALQERVEKLEKVQVIAESVNQWLIQNELGDTAHQRQLAEALQEAQ